MCKCILNILDIKNLLGMRRPIPAYPQTELVLKVESTPIDLVFFVGNSADLIYISGGEKITTTYPSTGSFRNMSVPADPGTNIVFAGSPNNIGVLGVLSGDVSYISANAALQVPIVAPASLKTMDLRNVYLSIMYNASIEVANNISTLYAVANTTDQRDICVTYINYSTVTNGVLWIDKTQAYANDVIAAAQAKGWKVYGL